MMKTICMLVLAILVAATSFAQKEEKVKMPIVDTGQTVTYDTEKEIPYPKTGEAFYGQDAQYAGNQPSCKDNGDGTVTDKNTGLMWMKIDSGKGMTWEEALAYAENSTYAAYSDWRLPNIKELQYLVDYKQSPDTTKSPAIDPIFQTSSIKNEAGQEDYPFYWSSTTFLAGPVPPARAACISFGRALGEMHSRVMDVHGAGAQRPEQKTGNASIGRGFTQGGARRTQNYVRLVRGGTAGKVRSKPKTSADSYPEKIKVLTPNPTKPVLLGAMSIMGKMERGRMGGFVKRLDKDNDGKVSRSEFDGAKIRFEILDKNRDGYLSEDEASKRSPNR